MTLTDAPDLLTVAEAAHLLRLSPNSVYRALAAGELPGIKIRGAWRIPKAQLEALVLGTSGKG